MLSELGGGKGRDERQIEFDDPSELLYWLKYFETSKDELLAAVSAVGTSASAVGMFLRGKQSTMRRA
jgi:hypothetical protein